MRFILSAVALLGLAPGIPAQADPFRSVEWLVGCWERTSGARRSVEQWFPPAGGSMPGVARTWSDTSVRETEHLRLFYLADTLVYEAHPAGQARARFPARGVGTTELRFENPAHDFPQQITYTRIGADSLVARTEGDGAGRRGPVDFRFRRIPCEGLPHSPTVAARTELRPHYEGLERREAQGYYGRFEGLADLGGPGYRYIRWAAPGSEIVVWDAAALRRVALTLRQSVAALKPRDLRYAVDIEQVVVHGDTAQVLATGRQTWRMTDDAGRVGPPGGEHERGSVQRWLDHWIRHGEAWRLASTALILDEVLLDGRVTVRDGRPVASTP